MPAPLPEQLDPSRVDSALAAARAVMSRAHAPYSGFLVGAVLCDEEGRCWSGCNVECASYGLTICAERGAVAKAVSEGAREFSFIALASSAADALMPCGACRQVLYELGPELIVVSEGTSGERRFARLDELLPYAFGPADLDAASGGEA